MGKKKTKRCKRCGKRWCGTNRQVLKLYPSEAALYVDTITFGSKKCRRKGPKR